MVRLYKEGEEIQTPLQIGDIIELESGVFVSVKEIVKETEEGFADIKKINLNIKCEVISKANATRKNTKRFSTRDN